jgi:glucose-1-phosphate cytidylyltransferase
MKTVILAGGMGSRLAEETAVRPKPMVEIGGRPILWHIMSIYAAQGFTDFTVAAGYKSEMIKEYFARFYLHLSDIRVDLATGTTELLNSRAPDWRVEIIDTGVHTMTGGRVKRLRERIDGTFMLTYGDGVGAVEIRKLLEFHKAHGGVATLTAVRPPARFGGLTFDGDRVAAFSEKPQIGEGWINGGFMVLEPKIFDYIEGDDTVFEKGPLETLANEGKLFAFKHEAYWQPMDTIRERQLLEQLWDSGKAPWKTW